MGIRFQCPNGHKLNVKADLAGKRASCPECGVKLVIPAASTEPTTGQASSIGPPRNDWYLRSAIGGQIGPATDAMFRAWIAEGRVTADSQVRRDDWAEWKLARDAADELPIPLAGVPVPVAPSPAAAIATAPPPMPPEKETEQPVFPESPDAVELSALPADVLPTPSRALPRSKNAYPRRKTQSTQLTLAVVMLVAVIVLAGMLVWVIRENVNATSGAVNSTSNDSTAVGSPGKVSKLNRLAEPSEAT